MSSQFEELQIWFNFLCDISIFFVITMLWVSSLRGWNIEIYLEFEKIVVIKDDMISQFASSWKLDS